MNVEPFGEWLRRLRKESGTSQLALAQAVGIDHTYLSKIESGKMPPPGEDTLCAIASVLSIDQDTIFRQAGKVPPRVQVAFIHGMSDEAYRLFLVACGAADCDYRKRRDEAFKQWQEDAKIEVTGL